MGDDWAGVVKLAAVAERQYPLSRLRAPAQSSIIGLGIRVLQAVAGRDHPGRVHGSPRLLTLRCEPTVRFPGPSHEPLFHHATRSAASPHIRWVDTTRTKIPPARGRGARKSGAILLDGVSQPRL